jgi:hypothetical protein
VGIVTSALRSHICAGQYMQRWAVTYKVHVWMSSSFVIIGLRFRCFEVGERVSVGSNHDCRERKHVQDKPDTHSQQPTSLATEHLKQSKDRQSPLVGLTSRTCSRCRTCALPMICSVMGSRCALTSLALAHSWQ